MHRNSGVTLLIVWLSLLAGLKRGQAESICAFYDKSFPLSSFVDTKDTDTDNAVKSYEGETSSKEMEKASFGGEILPDNKTIRCVEDKTFCYTLWSADAHNKTQITIIKQGCWIGEEACTNVNCLSKTEPKPIPPSNSSQESKFCCCSSNMCNENVTDVYVPGLHTTAIPVFPEFDQNYRERTIIISLVSVCSVALVTIVVYFLYRVLVTSKRVSMDSLNIMEAAPPPNITLEDLKLSCNVNRGRYSEVWKGLLNDQEVAVKIYPANYKQHYLNERSIYSLPFMEHENLLQFYGSDERLSQEGNMQYMLIFNYIPIGSLSGYLKHNTVDWPTLCKMCISFTRGLAHLHNDITKGGK
ncbi:bone morphogenetic protein receptor type-2 [Patella vulgata]|uniref:bone morphogenetic protein receptor type-2 n=1 Tax=Patella vulgata TaxID=6465 RepID=UPI00217FAD2A|nr:bone morphogenetic protein receptor type-2 [Patella vulgata]